MLNASKAKAHLSQNVRYRVFDKDGNAKAVFQQNALFTWLLKRGYVSPHFFKIPFLLGNPEPRL